MVASGDTGEPGTPARPAGNGRRINRRRHKADGQGNMASGISDASGGNTQVAPDTVVASGDTGEPGTPARPTGIGRRTNRRRHKADGQDNMAGGISGPSGGNTQVAPDTVVASGDTGEPGTPARPTGIGRRTNRRRHKADGQDNMAGGISGPSDGNTQVAPDTVVASGDAGKPGTPARPTGNGRRINCRGQRSGTCSNAVAGNTKRVDYNDVGTSPVDAAKVDNDIKPDVGHTVVDSSRQQVCSNCGRLGHRAETCWKCKKCGLHHRGPNCRTNQTGGQSSADPTSMAKHQSKVTDDHGGAPEVVKVLRTRKVLARQPKAMFASKMHEKTRNADKPTNVQKQWDKKVKQAKKQRCLLCLEMKVHHRSCPMSE